MAGSKKGVETVRGVLPGSSRQGVGDPLLAVSDGARGVIRAIDECFPRSARQRCDASLNISCVRPADLGVRSDSGYLTYSINSSDELFKYRNGFVMVSR
jgi:hypothetical protein